MFANFIYFLVALILYTTCRYPEGVENLPENAVLNAFLLGVAFVLLCRLTFRRILKKTALKDRLKCDQKLNAALTRLSILAVLVFAADLYLFRLKILVSGLSFFRIFPTFGALVFLSLFLFYLVVVWDSAWQVQKKMFPGAISRKNFVLSNIAFSLPALIPWFAISIVADIIQILPFKRVSGFLSTPLGEICYLLIFLMAVAVFGPLLIRKLWRCSPLEPGAVRNHIMRICEKADLKFADILKWELFGGTMITAGIMGLVGRFRYILVTPALTRYLTEKETEAVISHEIGHVKKHHLVYYLLFFVGYIGCIYFLFDPLILTIYSARPVHWASAFTGISHDTSVTLFFTLTLVLLFVLYFRYVFGFFMRNFERQADTYVLTLMTDAAPLVTTFFKIARYSGQSPEKPNWHHFSVNERIAFMEKCQEDGSAVNAHDRKVKKMIAGYFFIILIVFAGGYSVNFGEGREVFNTYIAEKILAQELRIDPGNSDLFSMIGDLYFNRGQYENAARAWENVLRIDAGNLHALNNLAWLYATCEDKSLRDPEKALKLAEKAAGIKRAPYVLDTYAHACFVNGKLDMAVALAKEALAKSSADRRAYYKEQLEKFRRQVRERGNGNSRASIPRLTDQRMPPFIPSTWPVM